MMDTPVTAARPAAADAMICCQDSSGLELQGNVTRLTRHSVVFEVYSPFGVLKTSEVLREVRIVLGDRMVFSGQAVVRTLISPAIKTVCEATLSEGWRDVGINSVGQPGRVREDWTRFVEQWNKHYRIDPEYKIVIADLQSFLSDLRCWLDQVELEVHAAPSSDELQLEQDVYAEVFDPIQSMIGGLFERFEAVAKRIEPDLRPAHQAYVKRQLHPLVLCAPFMYRTFTKPLGYAGDFEMVNMMVCDQPPGHSLFARTLNRCFLNTAPVVAHRNRLCCLVRLLTQEGCRVVGRDRSMRVFNLGCGPAIEIQRFLRDSELSQQAQFTLLDFNNETLVYAESVLRDTAFRHGRRSQFTFLKRSVAQLIKDASKPSAALAGQKFDLVYCAGLFDYLPDQVCLRLMDLFYNLVAPGGLVVITNVDPSNPSQGWMDLAVDWHLFHRNSRQLLALRPTKADSDCCTVWAEPIGVNVFLQVRKPLHAD